MATPSPPSMSDPTPREPHLAEATLAGTGALLTGRDGGGTEPPGFGAPYETWLAEHGVPNINAHRNHYQTVSQEVLRSFNECAFWKNVLPELPNIDDEYLITHKFPLIFNRRPEIIVKPWQSFLQKTYRKNISTNIAFPNPPEGGWYLPSNWYNRIHDIVRTTITVKYLDGVPLVLEKLKTMANTEALAFDDQLEARIDGYYGAHFNCFKGCEIFTIEWTNIIESVALEIQITTQIKDVIKSLLHKYYETSRMSNKVSSIVDISWNYENDEFITAYLGHILHYVEGMIINVRDRERGRDA
jgi:ppGpp synthetase/RelA/SpoT-type nucleotidyltranferase